MPSAEEIVSETLDKMGCSIDMLLPEQELQVELGLDSTEFVELVALVQRDYGVALKQSDWSSIQTIGDLTSKINTLLIVEPNTSGITS
jgi:acyl carrier protein